MYIRIYIYVYWKYLKARRRRNSNCNKLQMGYVQFIMPFIAHTLSRNEYGTQHPYTATQYMKSVCRMRTGLYMWCVLWATLSPCLMTSALVSCLVFSCVNTGQQPHSFLHTSGTINTIHTPPHTPCYVESCLFLYFLASLSQFFVHVLSLSQRFIVCRIEGTGVISITHSNTLTSPLLSLHWSLVPKPLAPYWQGPPNFACRCACVRACTMSYCKSHAF